MATVVTEISFFRDDYAAVVETMARLEARGDGGGWINLSPVLSEEEERRVPQRSLLGAWFSGRGPAVAMATWTPSTAIGRRPRPAQIGLAHGTGPNALARLDEVGAGLPPGWVKRQDHAKHGIVAEVPARGDHGTVLTWMIVAATVLRTVVEPGMRWTALVHEPD